MKIRIILADDHEIFHEGLRTVLDKASNLEIMSYAKDGSGSTESDLMRKTNAEIDENNLQLSRLTSRERETLQLIAEGYPTKQIAYKLSVSVKTISTHRENLMQKLEIHSIAGLTKYAIRAGLTALD